jgi:glyoxylase-like metal-dependent hydrolase (beta-lactamase superfamily II)
MDQYTISPEELNRKLDAREVEFIFDLRNPEEFAGWRIEGKTDIETLNIPKADFVGEEDSHLGRLPRDRAILTVCAHGDASRYAAEQLRERGFNALSLEGGMERWSELYEIRRVRTDPVIHQIYRTARGCITHVVISGNEAVVIDAVRHIDRILDLAASSGARITHVFDTHLQADHISGGRDIANKTGAVYHLHPVDAEGATYPFAALSDGEVIRFGTSRLKAVHAPGHTPGSTALLLDDAVLFTGDTVMKAGIGRPDLGGKAEPWARLLFDTLFTRFARFADPLLILPSHAASVKEQDSGGIVSISLGKARQRSDLFQIRNFPAFLARVVASLPENPERYQDIRKVNLGLLDPDEAQRKELEIGKNLCAMAQAG